MERARHVFAGMGIWAATTIAIGLAAPSAAWADAWGSFKGKIFVSDVEFGSYGSDQELSSAVKKQSKTTIKGDGAWSFNLMVFLKEAPGADKVNIVYYDVSAKREQVN